MNIGLGNSLFSSVMATQNSFAANASEKIKQQNKDLVKAGRELHDQIGNNRTGYEMAQENVDLSKIWQRARDWGLTEQQKMVNRARELSVQASSDLVPDNARNIMQKELESLQAEMTRIGLSNNINGSKTLSRTEVVQEVEYVEEVVEVETEEVEVIQPQIDVLWVVDRSGSMGDNISHLKKDAEKMYSALSEKGFKTRMAIESFEINLDNNGSTDFRDTESAFIADVNSVLGNIAGGLERGLISSEEAIERFEDKFDENVTKVVVMITDETSDDFFDQNDISTYWKTEALEEGSDAESMRQRVADKFKDNDTEFFVVSGYKSQYYDANGQLVEQIGGLDEDYTDVVDKVGKGGSVILDRSGEWVDTITERFIASVETDIEKGKFDGIVKTKIVSEELKELDEWDLNFQVGPDAEENIVETFWTSTSRTSGFEIADISTAEKARDSLELIDSTTDFLADEHTQVGVLQNTFKGIQNDLFTRAINDSRPFSLFTSAMSTYIDASVWGFRI